MALRNVTAFTGLYVRLPSFLLLAPPLRLHVERGPKQHSCCLSLVTRRRSAMHGITWFQPSTLQVPSSAL